MIRRRIAGRESRPPGAPDIREILDRQKSKPSGLRRAAPGDRSASNHRALPDKPCCAHRGVMIRHGVWRRVGETLSSAVRILRLFIANILSFPQGIPAHKKPGGSPHHNGRCLISSSRHFRHLASDLRKPARCLAEGADSGRLPCRHHVEVMVHGSRCVGSVRSAYRPDRIVRACQGPRRSGDRIDAVFVSMCILFGESTAHVPTMVCALLESGRFVLVSA